MQWVDPISHLEAWETVFYALNGYRPLLTWNLRGACTDSEWKCYQMLERLNEDIPRP